ncbi:MAG: PaaI family thioesterase [Gammaproteobacteria bacterium]
MRDFRAQDEHYETRVRESFARQKVMAFLGAEMTEVNPGACEIRLPYHEGLSQQHGFFHGGIVGTIADSAAGYAGYSLMPPDASVLTVEYKMNLLAPADGDLLIARGEVIKAGRNLVITKADVEVVKEQKSKPCATLLQTLMTAVNRPDLSPG